MHWQPLTITKQKIARDIQLFGEAPADVQELFKRRAENPGACDEACDAILAYDPHSGIALFYKAVLAQERGDFEAVLKYAKPITERTPLIFHAWQLRGMGEMLSGDTESARTSFMHFGHVQRDAAWPWCLIALTYLLEHEIELAVYTLDEVMRTQNVTDAHMLLWVRAFIEEKAGDVHAAISHLIELQMMSDGDMRERAAHKVHSLLFLQDGTGV